MSNLEYIKMLSAMYYCKSDKPEDWKKIKVDYYHKGGHNWYTVGHNSTHNFYLAVDEEDNIWRRSYSSEQAVDTSVMSMKEYYLLLDSENESDNQLAYNAEKEYVSEHIDKCDSIDSIGYLGHW